VHVGGFSLAPDAMLDIQLDSTVNTSGKISAQARVAPHSGVVTAHVEAQHLGLTALQPLLAQYTSMTLLNGELATRVDFERHADGTIGVKGDTEVANLATVDDALKKDFIKWQSLRVADVAYRSRPASLRIGTITAVDPYVRMIIAPDRSTNIKEVLTAPGAKPAAPPADVAAATATASTSHKGKAAPAPPAAPPAPLTPFPMSIGTVKMVNGSADYTDLWIKPSFALGMQALNGSVTGLSSDPKSRARIQLDGKLANYSPLHIAGELNVLSAALYTDVTLSFKDLDLTIADPYSGYFVGYKIDKGKLSVDVSYKIEQRKLNAEQHFVVDQLELGDTVDSPEAMHLPLKLAVALLKDPNGVIDLPLPMSGSLDDPSFKVGPIIWKVFVNLIEKAVTAPFALLGHLFGGGEHMNVVEFAPGSAELSKATQDQLASLEKALQQRPQLKLDVPIVTSARLDGAQLARAQVETALAARAQGGRAGTAEAALADPGKRLPLLIEQFHADLGKDAALPASAVALQAAKKKDPDALAAANTDLEAALIGHAQVADADLDKLGRARAAAIQNALLTDGQVDPGRVFIVNAAAKADSGDSVKAELAVH
jgi:Domain of Unknown Function (DUF748)